MAKLILRDGKGSEDVHEIADDVTTFGRSSANIIQVKDEQSSRQHCRIEKAGDGYRLVDLGSRNGTKVNGVKVSSQTLKPGDVITIGDYSITFDQKIEVSADELGATVAVDLEDARAAAAAPAGAGQGGDRKDPLADQMQPQFVIEVVEGGGTGTRIELGVDPVKIGRNASNDLVIDDEAASNFHAEITKEAIGYVVSDLGSTNGTKVNDEKIVKSPLAHGSRVQIGSTVIAFKNLGAPTEEDAVFGTVVLDSDKLDRELAAARSGGGAGRLVAALVLMALIGLGAYGVTMLIRGAGGDGDNGQGNDTVTITEVRNPSFREGTESDGSPREWTVIADHPRNRVIIDKDKGRESGDEQHPRYSARFQRHEGAKPNAAMVCRQAGSFGVDKGSGYRASAWVLCPGAEGLYGVRLTWVGAGRAARELDQYATISGAHPEWKQVRLDARPPRWASRIRLSLVAWGNTDSVWFDDAALEKIPAAEVADSEETIEFRGVNAAIDRSGRLNLGRGGVPALTGLIVAEGQGGVRTDQDLAQVAGGFPRSEGGRHLFRGTIYDFARNRRFGYDLAASKGNEGVSLSYAFNSPGGELTLDSLALRFTIEPAFAGKPEVYTSKGRKPFRRGTASGVQELLLRSGEKELVFSFEQPATLAMTPRGEKRELEVLLAKSPSLGSTPIRFALELASRSARAIADRKAAFEQVFGLFEARKWSAFPAEAASARRRFPGAASQLARLDSLERKYAGLLAKARASADAAVRLAEEAEGVEAWQVAYDSGKKRLNALKAEWAGTSLAGHLDACLVKLEEGKTRLAAQARESEARKWLKRAESPMKTKQWPLAEVYLKKVINDYGDTKAAADARKLLDFCAKNRQREALIISQEEALLRKIKNYELNKQYKEAIRIIEADEGYRKFGREMKEVQAKLEALRALAK
jgi:pSer/pThr/pTyr-binding forkhead associated (FHA) protein